MVFRLEKNLVGGGLCLIARFPSEVWVCLSGRVVVEVVTSCGL